MSPDKSADPPVWVFQALQSIREEMTGQHQRMRSDMMAGFDRIEAKLDKRFEKYETEQRELSDRVLVLEQEKRVKAVMGGSLVAWIGVLLGLLTVCAEWLGLWKRHA